MWYRYNAVNFLPNTCTHKDTPRFAREGEVWVSFVFNVWLSSIPVAVVPYIKEHYNGSRYNGTRLYLYLRPTKLERGMGILDSPCPSVRPGVRPSVCRRHGFRSISQVCFGISISNFICMLMVAIDFQRCQFQNSRLAAILNFLVSRLQLYFGFEYQL